VAADFEELDRRATPMGVLVLRRRIEPSLRIELFEVQLGDEYLMSSLFTVAEIALATLGLDALPGRDLDVVVGGLGLGFTARAVLDDPRVRSLTVVEALGEVIDWHERELVPHAHELMADPRCDLVQGDFFALAAGRSGFSARERHHAILVDIDHTPRHHLHGSHAAFYTTTGLRRIVDRLHAGGVFGLWSDDPPDDDFLAQMRSVFATAVAHEVSFPNPLTGARSANTVYVGTAP
jgi:spermidine synthase